MKLWVVLVLPVALYGCGKKVEFSCDNPVVIEKVVSMQSGVFFNTLPQIGALGQLAGVLEILGEEELYTYESDYENIKFSLKNIRTVSRDQDLGNYKCRASLVSQKGPERQHTEEITYTSEAVEQGESTYINTSQLSMRQIGALASVLIKERELVEKAMVGELDYGTSVSDIGEFSFASESDIGRSIISECANEPACEVKAMVEETEFGDIIRKLIHVKKM